MIQFIFRKINNKYELEEVFKLRYKVYCEEWGFEKPEEHLERKESDEFDDHSIHFVSFDDSQKVIGTIRIILNSEKGFPIEKHSKIDAELSSLNRNSIGEISRLAVSKEYRKRLEDSFLYETNLQYHQQTNKVPHERRKRHEIVLGLYKCIYAESKKIGLTHWYAVMAEGLYILLKRIGIIFSPIGPKVNYHGIRTPYIGCIKDIEDKVARHNPDLFREFQKALI